MTLIILPYTVMCLIFGTTFLTIRLGLNAGLPPFLFAAMRFLLAGICILIFYVFARGVKRFTLTTYVKLTVIATLTTTIPYGALFWSEQYISSGLSSLLVATAPLFTAVFAMCIGQMKWKWHLALGLLLGIAGTACLIEPSHGVNPGSHSVMAKLVILAAELSYGIGTVVSKKALNRISPFLFNGLQSLFGGAELLILSLIFEHYGQITWSITSLVSVIYLSFFASILALGIFYWLVLKTNAAFPSTWTYAAPLIAMTVGAIFLGEQVRLGAIFGGICILSGLVLLNWNVWLKDKSL